MIRLLIKIIVFLVLASLVYGLWLMYQEKKPEERQELRSAVIRTFRDAGRISAAAFLKTVEKGKSVIRQEDKQGKQGKQR
jgi:hypothetical protein